jgi:lysophospholipase L1-like esterase
MRRAALLFALAAAQLAAVTPVVTSFTTSTATPIAGQTFQICWVASNVPTSITITPGLTGDQTTTYVDSTNPATGCATFTPPLARLRFDGDSLTCGFRATGAAQNAPASGTPLALPCNPNPSPNGAPNTAWPVRARAGLEQTGYSIASYVNLAIVGITASGHTPTTCASTTFNPDVLGVTFGANDMQGITTNGQADTVYANLKTLWAAAKPTCKVVVWTLTPRSSGPAPDSVRVYLNGLITGTPALYDAIINIGATSDAMGCAGCNTTDTTDYNADGTHYTDAGYAHAGALGAAAIAPLMSATYSITANNVSGTSAAVTLAVSARVNPPATVSSMTQ